MTASNFAAGKIEILPIASLAPRERNPRTHSPRQIKQIARSIERFGFLNPILIDSHRRIVCGHGRLEAAKRVGYTHVPTLTLEHLSETELRAFVIADNRLAEQAGWDKEILAIELQGLIDLEFPVQLTGFETAEIDILLEECQAERDTDDSENAIPPVLPDRVVCRAGDLWILGSHRLLCGDARSADAYSVLMNGEKAEFVFTDPPYNVPIQGHVSGLGRVRHREFAVASGELSSSQFVGFLQQVFQKLASNTADGSIHEICMDWRHLREMLDAGFQIYSELKNVCVWNKSNAGMGSFYRSKHELIFCWKNGHAPHINNIELGKFGRSRANVWDYPSVNSFGSRMSEHSMHPTVKPVGMVKDAIKDCSRRGSIVLDPFVGSGTLCIAAELTGRHARAIELDPIYCDVAIRRWQLHTGKLAVHAPSSQSFDELEDKSKSQETPNVGARGAKRGK